MAQRLEPTADRIAQHYVRTLLPYQIMLFKFQFHFIDNAISGLSGFRALHNELLEVLQVPYSQSRDKEQFARQVTVNSFENVINMSFIYFSKVVPDTITEFSYLPRVNCCFLNTLD